VINRIGKRACVYRVVPRSRVAVALEAENHRLSIGHHLIHVELKVADVSRGSFDVDIGVIEEVHCRGVIAEGD